MEKKKRHYRADIDGLRAIAVVSVILFHLNIWPFTGGFVGVDVFFVISGYLITGIIVREMDEGRFSILRFYERRARRIAPALFGVVIAALVIGYMLFMPDDLVAFGKSALATLFMVANIFWWNDVDYFAAPPDTKPLLHMWSLGIEEQFYLFLPLILWLVSRRALRRFRPLFLSVLLLVSLVACIIVTRKNAPLAFFWLPFRAWELLIGGMLVFLPKSDRLPAEMVSVLSTLGLITLCIPIFLLHHHSTFPGSNALTPVLGAAVVIWAGSGRQPLANRLLSFTPFMWVGLISYSLYLWHWSIIVFMRYWLMEPLSIYAITVALVLTFVSAAFSYRFIEQPFRNHEVFGIKAIFGWTGFGVACLSIIGLGFIFSHGMPSRLPKPVLQYADGRKDVSPYQWECFGHHMPPDASNEAACHIGNPAVHPSFVLWGDSFAAAIAPGIDTYTRKSDKAGILVAVAGCMPILGVGSSMDINQEACHAMQDNFLSYIDDLKPDTVILSSNWYLQFLNGNFHGVTAKRYDSFYETIAAAFDNTIAELRKRQLKIIIVTSFPVYEKDVPTVLARQLYTGRQEFLSLSLGELESQSELSNRMFAKYRRAKDMSFVDPSKILCASGKCITALDGYSLYFDPTHVNMRGARLVSPIFKPLLEGASSQK